MEALVTFDLLEEMLESAEHELDVEEFKAFLSQLGKPMTTFLCGMSA